MCLAFFLNDKRRKTGCCFLYCFLISYFPLYILSFRCHVKIFFHFLLLKTQKKANPDEKARANTFAETICTEGTVKVLEGADAADDEFWGYLADGEIAEADHDDHHVEEFAPLLFKLPGGDDAEPEQVGKGESVKIGFITACKISKDLLTEDDVFLLDAGWEIFLWVGKDADRSEKLGAFAKADKYCADDLRTIDLPVTFIKSGYETSAFNNFFA